MRARKSKAQSANKDFVLEEYKAKCEYIRHVESLDAKVIYTYYVITGVVFWFFFASDGRNHYCNPLGARQITFTFLCFYSFAIILWFLHRKKNYKIYNDRLLFIEECYCLGAPRIKNSSYKLFTAFRLHLAQVAVVSSFVFSTSLFVWHPNFIGMSVFGGVCFFLLSYTLSFLERFDH